MPNDKNLEPRVAVTELLCKQNEAAWKETLKEIRALPHELKKMIFEQFTNHQVYHTAIEKRDASQDKTIEKLISRLSQIEVLVIKIKSNWKLVAGAFSVSMAGVVWLIQKAVEVVFFTQ